MKSESCPAALPVWGLPEGIGSNIPFPLKASHWDGKVSPGSQEAIDLPLSCKLWSRDMNRGRTPWRVCSCSLHPLLFWGCTRNVQPIFSAFLWGVHLRLVLCKDEARNVATWQRTWARDLYRIRKCQGFIFCLRLATSTGTFQVRIGGIGLLDETTRSASRIPERLVVHSIWTSWFGKENHAKFVSPRFVLPQPVFSESG